MSEPVQTYLELVEEIRRVARSLEEQYDAEMESQFERALEAVKAAYIAVPYDKRLGLNPPPTRPDFFFEWQ